MRKERKHEKKRKMGGRKEKNNQRGENRSRAREKRIIEKGQ